MWQDQSVEVVQMSLDDVRRKAHKFEKRISYAKGNLDAGWTATRLLGGLEAEARAGDVGSMRWDVQQRSYRPGHRLSSLYHSWRLERVPRIGSNGSER